MSDCNNNNIVSVERDICTGIGKNTIHQLNKLDEKLGKRKRVRIYPITYIQAVYDAKTGTRLDNFLNMVNSIYLPWRGTAKSTRLQVPYHLRRKGLMISYRNIDNEIITEKCILEDCIKDDLFKLDSSWVRITDALPVSGNVTIGSNGNWFVDGEDTGFKAQGPKGDNGMPLQPRLSEDGTKIEYSLDGDEWQELFPLSLITPTVQLTNELGDSESEAISQKGVTEQVNLINAKLTSSGATESRPESPSAGVCFLDTTLGKPVWWNGSAWIDATGETV